MVLPVFIILINYCLKKEINIFKIAICVVVIFFIRQTSGLILFLAISTGFIIGRNWRYFFQFSFLSLIFVVIVFSTMYLNGNLNDYFELSFSGQKFMLAKGNTFWGQIKYIFSTAAWTFSGGIYRIKYWLNPYGYQWFPHVYYVFFWVFCFSGIYRIYRKIKTSKNSKIDELAFLVSLASISQMYPISCIQHNYWAFSPILPIVFYYIHSLFNLLKANQLVRSIKIHKMSFFIFGIVLLISISARMRGLYDKINNYEWVKWEYNNTPVNGMYITKEDANFLIGLRQYSGNKRIVYQDDIHGIGQPYLIPFILRNNTNKNNHTSYFFYKDSKDLKGKKIDSTELFYHIYSENSGVAELILTD